MNNFFNIIINANPRSVTVFLDSFYSGTTRGTDMLIASRPIALYVPIEQSIPDNFVVFSSFFDQISKPLQKKLNMECSILSHEGSGMMQMLMTIRLQHVNNDM